MEKEEAIRDLMTVTFEDRMKTLGWNKVEIENNKTVVKTIKHALKNNTI